MGRSADTIWAVLGDVATLLTGNPMFAIEGNAEAAVDSAISGRNKDALGFGLSAVGSGAAPALGKVGGAIGKGLGSTAGSAFGEGAGNALGKAGQFLGTTAGELGGTVGTQFLEPGLAKSLGLYQTTPSAPSSTTLTPATKTGAGGGAGPAAGPGGLDVQGGTAPQIYPYVKSSPGGSAPQGQQMQQQQPKGI